MVVDIGPELASIAVLVLVTLTSGGVYIARKRKKPGRDCENCGRRLGFAAYYCSECLTHQLERMQNDE